MRHLHVTIAMLATIAVATSVSADPTPDRPGRFSMSPVDGGMMRLDTETGAIALCTRQGANWACESVKDGNSDADDRAKLEAENRRLKERVKALEDLAASLPPLDPPANGEAPGGITKLPSEEDVDKALDYVERMFKKLRDRIQKFEEQPGTSTKPSPSPGAL
jgi:hypothetical protein